MSKEKPRGSIVEESRSIDEHPLLKEIYNYHDKLISEYTEGDVLEIAGGKNPYPNSDIVIEADKNNINIAKEELDNLIQGDLLNLPFKDKIFDTIIGRRFIHHIPLKNRKNIFLEAERVLTERGRIIIIEGTPGKFRKITKGIANKLGILDEKKEDVYGHLTSKELENLFNRSNFELLKSRKLGSPFIPFSYFNSTLTKKLKYFHKKTQFIRWYTLIIGELKD
ncbi:class I SAM-dependent methyltransferase [archaeon SCG-AAA382B04]|nr:class I SAM-dependent methyltransferase [archaeon SCG-AAA382B04]